MVFISDTHIGIGDRTNWYQRDVHESALVATLDYVSNNADSIAELILLGDIVDQWTYPPDVTPPSLAMIAEANPRVFARHGALARTIEALDGNVTVLSGNHDQQLTAADVGLLRDHSGRSPRLATAFPYVPRAGLGQVACAHGHQFSIFNAPDPLGRMPAELPIGHFVTRLVALYVDGRLGPGQTAADEPKSADPTGWAWEKDELFELLADVVEGKDSLSRVVIDALLRATNADSRLPIKLYDGSVVTLDQVRDELYRSLFFGFQNAQHYPGSAYGSNAAWHALIDSDLHNNLGHFAAELGTTYRAVVLGHIHQDRGALLRPDDMPTAYANSGFGCPSLPDMTRSSDPELPTFAEVAVDQEAGEVTTYIKAIESSPAGPVVVELPQHRQVVSWAGGTA